MVKKHTPSPRCPACGKVFMSATQLAHHITNADRLCNQGPTVLANKRNFGP